MTEDGPWASDTVTYTYDNRLRATLSLAQPSGSWSQTYGYDAGKRLKTLVSGAGTFSYDYPDGTRLATGSRLPEQLNLPVGYITNVHDTLARLQNTSLRAPAGTALDWEGYAYNNASQRTHQINALGGNYVSYAYDARGQLTNAAGYTSTGTARSQEKWAYTYDAAGNLSKRIKNALTNTFTVNNNNMASGVANSGTITVGGVTTPNALLVTVNGTPATLYTDDYSFALANVALTTPSIVALASNASGTISVTNTLSANATVTGNYDTNGNLTSDGTRLFTYDPDNQLVQVIVTNSSTKSAKTDFVYDGRMRRRVRTEAQWISSAWVTNTVVRYIYDGMRVIQERDANNNVLVTYTWGNDLSGSLQGAGGVGGLLARTHPGPHHFYYHSDGNGNITAAINEAANLVAQYRYDPFGNLIYSKGALADINLYRFSSKEFTTNSGLYYYGFRFYDPNLQRWLNRDPLGEKGFEVVRRGRNLRSILRAAEIVEGPNLYSFVRNDPNDRMDLLGLFDGQTVPGFWKIEVPYIAPQYKQCGSLVTRATYPSNKCYRFIDNAATAVFAPHMFIIFPDGTRLTNGGDTTSEDHWTAYIYPIYIPINMDSKVFMDCVKKYMAAANAKDYTMLGNNCHVANDAINACGGGAKP